MRISFSAQSHRGNIRENNEDNLYCGGQILEPNGAAFSLSGEAVTPCIFAVCDGMGGQEYGEFASHAAVTGLTELEAAIMAASPDKIDILVHEYVTKTNDIICAKMREKSVRIGTTLALIIVTNDAIRPYNIGDSRIYELVNGKLVQISNDHNLTSQKIMMGVITKEQARHDRDRNKLTRYFGIFEDEMIIEAESYPLLPLTTRRHLLLCSDGLTDMIEDSKIEEILKTTPIQDAGGLLVKEALQRGGKDNVTCVIVDIEPLAKHAKPPGILARLFSGVSKRLPCYKK